MISSVDDDDNNNNNDNNCMDENTFGWETLSSLFFFQFTRVFMQVLQIKKKKAEKPENSIEK